MKVSGDRITWTDEPTGAYELIYIMDPALLRAGKQAVIWQSLETGDTDSATIPADISPISNPSYLAEVVVADSQYKRVALGSTTLGQ